MHTWSNMKRLIWSSVVHVRRMLKAAEKRRTGFHVEIEGKRSSVVEDKKKLKRSCQASMEDAARGLKVV